MTTGIFGGSFNPIHTGHAVLLSWLARNAGLDRIWIMVSPQNPLKDGNSNVADTHRLRMAEMVASRIEGITTSAFEFTLPRPSYTYATLRALQEKFPDDEFALIIGADNWLLFDRWRNHEEILARHRIIIYPRRGYDIDAASLPHGVTYLAEAPMIEISSTEVRRLLTEGGNPSFLLPDEVLAFILHHNLYVNNPTSQQ